MVLKRVLKKNQISTSTCLVCLTDGQGKGRGCDFQDVGSQFWDLDFTQGLQSGLRPWAPTSFKYKFTTSVCDGAWVRHRKTTRPGPELPDSRIPADWSYRGGCRAKSVIEGRPAFWCPARVEWARPFSGSQHRRCEHSCSLVPSTGGASTTVLWFPARAERGLEEERCVAAGERRGGGGQRRRKFKEEKCCSN